MLRLLLSRLALAALVILGVVAWNLWGGAPGPAASCQPTTAGEHQNC